MDKIVAIKQSKVMRNALNMFCEDFQTNDCSLSTCTTSGKCWYLQIYWGNPVWDHKDLRSYISTLQKALAEHEIAMCYCMCHKMVEKDQIDSKNYLVLLPTR